MMRGATDEAKEVLADSLTYTEIKNWFLNKYSAINEFHEKRAAALAA